MVNIFAEEGCSVHPSYVSISIVPPDTSKPIVNCDFREIQIGKFEFDFTPSTRGQYKMKVTLDNKDIDGIVHSHFLSLLPLKVEINQYLLYQDLSIQRVLLFLLMG